MQEKLIEWLLKALPLTTLNLLNSISLEELDSRGEIIWAKTRCDGCGSDNAVFEAGHEMYHCLDCDEVWSI